MQAQPRRERRHIHLDDENESEAEEQNATTMESFFDEEASESDCDDDDSSFNEDASSAYSESASSDSDDDNSYVPLKKRHEKKKADDLSFASSNHEADGDDEAGEEEAREKRSERSKTKKHAKRTNRRKIVIESSSSSSEDEEDDNTNHNDSRTSSTKQGANANLSYVSIGEEEREALMDEEDEESNPMSTNAASHSSRPLTPQERRRSSAGQWQSGFKLFVQECDAAIHDLSYSSYDNDGYAEEADHILQALPLSEVRSPLAKHDEPKKGKAKNRENPREKRHSLCQQDKENMASSMNSSIEKQYESAVQSNSRNDTLDQSSEEEAPSSDEEKPQACTETDEEANHHDTNDVCELDMSSLSLTDIANDKQQQQQSAPPIRIDSGEDGDEDEVQVVSKRRTHKTKTESRKAQDVSVDSINLESLSIRDHDNEIVPSRNIKKGTSSASKKASHKPFPNEATKHQAKNSSTTKEKEGEFVWIHDESSKEYFLDHPSAAEEEPHHPNHNKKIQYRIPSTLYQKMYQHQKDGVQWMSTIHTWKTGGILGDDMGMGKTLQTLTVIGGFMRTKVVRNALVVCPVSLLRTWEKEAGGVLRKCCVPRVTVSVLASDVAKSRRTHLLREAIGCSPGSPHLVITTYGLVGSKPQDLIPNTYSGKKASWDYVILDEGHKIKNAKTQVNKGCHKICGEHTRRLLLTGTPIQNNLRELWVLFDWATSGRLLGKLPNFLNRYAEPIEQGRHKNASRSDLQIAEKANKELQELLRPHFLQRSKKTFFKEHLPPKRDVVVWTRLSQRQRKLYEEFIASGRVTAVLSGETTSPLVAITWLKKLCGHPSLVLPEAEVENQENKQTREQLLDASCKLQLLVTLVEELETLGHRTLIFSQSTRMLDIIESVLEGTTLLRIDGQTKEKDRQKFVDRFNSDSSDVRVMLLSTRAAGLGLTLTGADRVIMFDPSWNPSEDAQAVDRCYRIGTKKPVTVFRMISCGTVEERIYEKQVHKDGIRRALLTESGCATERYFDKEDLRRLFELSPDGECTMLKKIRDSGQADAHDQAVALSDRPQMLESHPGVVGMSSHDLLYTGAPVDLEDEGQEKSPKYKTMGKARRILEKDSRPPLSNISNNGIEPFSTGKAKNSKAFLPRNIEVNKKGKEIQGRDLFKSNILNLTTVNQEKEKEMDLLLDKLEGGNMKKAEKLQLHNQIAHLARELSWL